MASQDRTVRVLLVLSQSAPLDASARRLLRVLRADKRYHIVGYFLRPTRPPEIPRAVALALSLERSLIPAPNRNPAPDETLDGLQDLGGTKPEDLPEADAAIDLSDAAAPFVSGRLRHGTWSVKDVNERAIHASLSERTTTDVELVRHQAADEQPQAISRASYDTKTLASHNVEYVREKSVQLVVRELARLFRDGAIEGCGATPARPRIEQRRLFEYLWRIAADAVDRVQNRLADKLGYTRQPFSLRLGHGDITDFDPAKAFDVDMPKNRYWADPFLIEHEAAIYCFFEDLDPKRGAAHISVGRVTDGGLTEVRPALVLPVHMSYPFVFGHEGEVFMIPETFASGRLEIWRAVSFPDEWELYSSALDGTPVADSTLLQRGDDWWLFTHISNDQFGDFCNELHVFKVDGPLLRSVEPHRLNPVVIGSDTARGAGRIQTVGGRILRPSQDNSAGTYGYGLNIMEIERLDLDHYQERRIRHVTPDFAPHLIGCHHIDAAGGWFVIDVRHD